MITIVVAYNQDRVIGQDGRLPWHLPAEMKHFREYTLGKVCIMGRRTWDSLKRPLKGRINIVVSRNRDEHEGAITVTTMEAAIKESKMHKKETCIIGGGEIYRYTLANCLADQIVASRVNFPVEGGELAYFPDLPQGWWVGESLHHPGFTVTKYRRKS